MEDLFHGNNVPFYVSSASVLIYRVISPKPSFESFMNLVFIGLVWICNLLSQLPRLLPQGLSNAFL